MIPNLRWLSRSLLFLAALPLLIGAFTPTKAHAATKLFIVANELGQIWQIDPATGNKITGFAVNNGTGARTGLAFDGTFLYFTDETRNVVEVYTTAGVLDHTLPKPPGLEPGSGLGASKTSLFLVDGNNNIIAIDPVTGAVQNSFSVGGAGQALTFAGSRSSVFVVVNDSTLVKELSPTGTELASITVPDIWRGLAFSSSSNTLYGVRGGQLWAADPVTGNSISVTYPVQIHDDVTGFRLAKSGAAAADEPVLEVCGDGEINVTGETSDPPGSQQSNGQVCRDNCTYCGDEHVDTNEQCDDGNTDNEDDCRNDCTLPRCGDNVKDPNEQCDDGNTADGDGCSATCTFEGFCGDGIVQPQLGEQCEPPNTLGCDANCHATEICLDLTDNDGDGLIDCADPDCDCLPIGRDPGVIRFSQSGAKDFVSIHGSLDPNTDIDPLTEKITFLLLNKGGTVEIFRVEIPIGDAKRIGRNVVRYRNALAQITRDGLAKFSLRYYPRRQLYTFELKAYGDLSLATEAKMIAQVAIGDDGFVNESTWKQTPHGWLLTLPGE
jgi:cysteine-rich repeat protein